MPRKLLLFGNGLGMALNPQNYSLSEAINMIWQNDELITPEHKQLISYCLPGEQHCPQGEEELSMVYLAANACSFLKSLQGEEESVSWLTDIGSNYPDACRNFIKETATKLYSNPESLPDTFINPLIEFIQTNNSHVATLNYDSLLYKPFIERQVCNGYSGNLVDGFWGTGFIDEHLERRYKNDFGYYLHLHGSPLFYRSEPRVKKSHINTPSHGDDRDVRDIVLANVRDKPIFIQRSPVLKSYWNYFCNTALPEAVEIIMIGYSGLDEHINQSVSIHARYGIPLRIVEWSGAGENQERQNFWSNTLKTDNLDLI